MELDYGIRYLAKTKGLVAKSDKKDEVIGANYAPIKDKRLSCLMRSQPRIVMNSNQSRIMRYMALIYARNVLMCQKRWPWLKDCSVIFLIYRFLWGPHMRARL